MGEKKEKEDDSHLLHPLEKRVRRRAVHVRLREEVALELEAVARAHVLERVEELIVALVGLVTCGAGG
jgi:hypothetical protein